MQSLDAAQLKELSKHVGGEGSVGHTALHAVLGGAGSTAQGASCAAGSTGALASVVLNQLLDNINDEASQSLTAQERQARVSLVGSVVAGITAAVDPSAAKTII